MRDGTLFFVATWPQSDLIASLTRQMLFSNKPREDIGQNPNFDPESTYFEIDYSDFFKYLDGSDGDSCFHKGNPSFQMSSTLESRHY